MADVEKFVIVGHSAEKMFHLVDAVESYPEFLPWCGGTQLHERTAAVTRVTIRIDYHRIRQSFTTRNQKEPPERMHIALLDGPFRRLEGHWHFRMLGDDACKIEFRLSYEFSSKLMEQLLGPMLNHIADTLVEAFAERADRLYGEGP